MVFHVLTIFPEFFRGPFEHGVIERAQKTGLIDIRVHDLRTWTEDRHRTVDDRPSAVGSGPGPRGCHPRQPVDETHPPRTAIRDNRRNARFVPEAVPAQPNGCPQIRRLVPDTSPNRPFRGARRGPA